MSASFGVLPHGCGDLGRLTVVLVAARAGLLAALRRRGLVLEVVADRVDRRVARNALRRLDSRAAGAVLPRRPRARPVRRLRVRPGVHAAVGEEHDHVLHVGAPVLLQLVCRLVDRQRVARAAGGLDAVEGADDRRGGVQVPDAVRVLHDVVVRRVAVDVVVRERGDDVEAAVLVLVGGVGLRLPPRGVGVEAVVEGARGRRAAHVLRAVGVPGLLPLRVDRPDARADRGRRQCQPDPVELGVHHGEEHLDAVTRCLEVTALAVRQLDVAHRPGAVEHDHDVEGSHRAGEAGRRLRRHGERVHADEPCEERRHLGDGLDGDGVHRRKAGVAAGDGGDATGDRGRGRVVDRVDRVLASRRRAVLVRRRLRERRVGELLRAGECGCVDPRLELALHEPRVPDVDHEGDDDERDRHQDAGHEQDLPALFRREPARKGRLRSRGVSAAHSGAQ